MFLTSDNSGIGLVPKYGHWDLCIGGPLKLSFNCRKIVNIHVFFLRCDCV